MRFLRREKGQAMVEFAIVLPIFILVLCGILDFGWYFFHTLLIENGAREGARYGAVNAANSNCAALVETKVESMIPTTVKELDVDVTFSTPSRTDGDIKVSVRGTVYTLTPVLGIFFENQKIPLKSEVTMKAES